MTKADTKPKAPAKATEPAATAPAPAADSASPSTVPKGFWEAADGSLWPESKVKEVDKLRDQVVKSLCAAAQTQSDQLAEFKRLALMEVQQFVDISASQYGVQMRGAAAKGNVTLTSFDGRWKVEKAIQDRVTFDERLQVAKAIFDEFVKEQQKGTSDTVKVLLTHAFRTDKAGKVSVRGILDLRTAAIDHPTWKRGIEAINDSMHAMGTATYLRFYRRNDETGEYLPISLSAAAA